MSRPWGILLTAVAASLFVAASLDVEGIHVQQQQQPVPIQQRSHGPVPVPISLGHEAEPYTVLFTPPAAFWAEATAALPEAVRAVLLRPTHRPLPLLVGPRPGLHPPRLLARLHLAVC